MHFVVNNCSENNQDKLWRFYISIKYLSKFFWSVVFLKFKFATFVASTEVLPGRFLPSDRQGKLKENRV